MFKQKMIRAVLGMVAISAVATPAFAQSADLPGGDEAVPSGDAATDATEPTTDGEPADTDEGVADTAPTGGEEATETIAEDDEGFSPDPVLDEYIAVSSKVAQRPSRTPASVAVISRDQIDLMGYNSVGEALRDVPGLFVSYNLQNYNVAVRGLLGGARSGSRLLKIMIDGRVAGFVSGGVYFLGPEFVPMSAVERIEVMDEFTTDACAPASEKRLGVGVDVERIAGEDRADLGERPCDQPTRDGVAFGFRIVAEQLDARILADVDQPFRAD